jgi:phage virion morphogenesis protein
MAGATIEARFEGLDRVRLALAATERLGRQPEAFLRTLGAKLASNTRDRIQAGRQPDGGRFAPLSPAYLPHKRGPSILIGAGMQGGLLGSITSRASGSEVAIGSNKVYAAIHQFGGTIRPKRPGGRLFFRTVGGQVWGVARQVTLPARPYLGLSDADIEDVLDAAEDRIALGMSRA